MSCDVCGQVFHDEDGCPGPKQQPTGKELVSDFRDTRGRWTNGRRMVLAVIPTSGLQDAWLSPGYLFDYPSEGIHAITRSWCNLPTEHAAAFVHIEAERTAA